MQGLILFTLEPNHRHHNLRNGVGTVRVGNTTSEIAKIQMVSEATVKFHVGNVLRKLKARSRPHAVAIALKMGLLKERQ